MSEAPPSATLGTTQAPSPTLRYTWQQKVTQIIVYFERISDEMHVHVQLYTSYYQLPITDTGKNALIQ